MMHWYSGFGPGWAGMLLMTLITLAVVAAVVLLAIAALRPRSRPHDDATHVPDLRLARGEIDEDEHSRLRRALTTDPR
ncbi:MULTISPECIES: SHOCT domain-containing protein [unclassified Saccharothrix]|uniref:SHOCT domain-containing protein n=1 Tax=unclassified Saccharothrix TaxID=2593673 RepID=UPI00307F8685